MKRNVLFITAALLLFLAGCSSKPATSLDNNGSTSTNGQNEQKNGNDSDQRNQEDAEKTEVSLLEYFLPDGSSAHYKGEGNEFAELDITVNSPAQDYIVIHENNGGSFIQKVYKLEGDEIQLLQQEPIELNEVTPSKEELEAMKPTRVYLKAPIEVGTTFGDWRIIETNAAVETPYKHFEQAVVLEQTDKDFTNRIYLVEGFGEVKRESIMTAEGEEDFIVTSTLESVTMPD